MPVRWGRSRGGSPCTGTSAGGGLAAAVAQRGHDEGISLRAQGLVYPMLDDRCTLRSDHRSADDSHGRRNPTRSAGPRTSAGRPECRTHPSMPLPQEDSI